MGHKPTASVAMSLSSHRAIPIPHKYVGVWPRKPWLSSPMESWVQLRAAHGYASRHTVKVRGLVQSMWSTNKGRDCTYLANDYSSQERPLVGGLGMDMGGRS